MNTTTLGKIAPNITSGSRGWASYYSDAGALFLRMTNLPKEGIGLLFHSNKYVQLPKGSSEGTRTRVHQNDILISITAELGKIGFVEQEIEEAYVNQHVALVRIESPDAYPKFIAYYLASNPQRNLLNRLNDAGAKSGLSLKTINKFPIFLPPLEEQKAIAGVLSTWDRTISTTEHLIQAKEKRFKWLINKLINEGSKNSNWRNVKLENICTAITQKNNVGETTVLTSSAKHGLISQLDYYNKSVAGKNLARYYLLKRGDFAYNRSSSKGYPYGATKRLDEYDQGVLSTLYLCFKLNSDKECYSEYLLNIFESGILNNEFRGICHEGARSHGLLNVTKSDFMSIHLHLPPLPEQKSIAETLNTTQREIDLLKKLADKYKEQKRGLMQKLLTGDWRVSSNILSEGSEEICK